MLSSLVDVCIEAILADEFWRLQRQQLLLLPEHLANRLLGRLLEQGRVNQVQLEIFGPSATSVCLAPHNHIGDGGVWLAAISRFRSLQTLHLQHCKRLREDRLALLAPFSSTLQSLSLNSCTRLTSRAAQHISALTSLTSLDLSGTALEISPLLGLTQMACLRVADMGVSDGDLAGIATLSRLTELDLRSTCVRDAGVQGLSRLLSLQSLDVTWTKATAPPALSSLTVLHMENCRVGGEVALRVLRSARFPRLHEVHMSMVHADEAGVELLKAVCSDSAAVLHTLIMSNAIMPTTSFIAPAGALCKLDLSGVQFNGGCWEMFSGLRSLQELSLQGSNAGNELVASLQGLSRLQVLSLKQTAVDDGALPLLQNMKGSLKSLDISSNSITGDPASQQAWGMLHRLHTLKLLGSKLTNTGVQALGQLGFALKALHVGSKRLTSLSFLRSCPQLVVLELDNCAMLTAPQFKAGMRHLHNLEELTVHDCAFVGKETVVEVAKALPLLYIVCDKEVLRNAKATHTVSRVGNALISRLQELAAFDERYSYTNEELLELRSSKCIPQLKSNKPLADVLSELELMIA